MLGQAGGTLSGQPLLHSLHPAQYTTDVSNFTCSPSLSGRNSMLGPWDKSLQWYQDVWVSELQDATCSCMSICGVVVRVSTNCSQLDIWFATWLHGCVPASQPWWCGLSLCQSLHLVICPRVKEKLCACSIMLTSGRLLPMVGWLSGRLFLHSQLARAALT